MVTGHKPKLNMPLHDEAMKKLVADELLSTLNHLLLECVGIADIIGRCLRVKASRVHRPPTRSFKTSISFAALK